MLEQMVQTQRIQLQQQRETHAVTIDKLTSSSTIIDAEAPVVSIKTEHGVVDELREQCKMLLESNKSTAVLRYQADRRADKAQTIIDQHKEDVDRRVASFNALTTEYETLHTTNTRLKAEKKMSDRRVGRQQATIDNLQTLLNKFGVDIPQGELVTGIAFGNHRVPENRPSAVTFQADNQSPRPPVQSSPELLSQLSFLSPFLSTSK
jgi:hypothetical protein